MRPRRLQLSGFTAFREEVTVDFEDAELFVLTGPTGSGKTSLIDAICFALYGAVPRLPRNAVEPVISLGAQEARVRFDFTVGDRSFTAARVVRRNKKGGASTDEARLEGDRGWETVSGADEVTAAVEDLLGFGFDHFTKCVVLPQGEFAAFLHDTPARRQDLLRRLLDLGLYERMRELATGRKGIAEGEAAALARQVEALTHATPEAEQEAGERVATLTRVREEVAEREPEAAALQVEIEATAQRLDEVDRLLGMLGRVEKPADLEEMSSVRAGAEAALAEAGERAETAVARVEAAERSLESLPPAEAVVEAIRLHQEVAEGRTRAEEARSLVEEAEEGVERARAELQAATETMERARRLRADLERRHRSHLLAEGLVEGEPCPVCGQVVTELPATEAPEGLADAAEADERAAADREAAQTATAKAEAGLDAARRRLAEVEGELSSLLEAVEGRPSPEEAEAAREARASAEEELDRARKAERAARAAVEDARRRLEQVAVRERDARGDFDRARDGVAMLDPPLPERTDLAADWEQLARWAIETAAGLEEERARLGTERVEVAARLADVEAGIAALLREAGLEPDPDRSARDTVLEAELQARQRLERVREDRERSAKLAEEAEARRRDAEVAKTMGRHLSATGFEAWLLEEALLSLVAGANHLLADLSAGSYSLEIERRDFVVVDHRNADERRSVRTLSGGETFLVSLALALSLAEQLAALAAGPTAKLESIFLDEGFGTLDAETLDTVASVIQELGASGRTVGLVTHVKELAEQVPVRFEVRKGPGGAVVERVEA